jgi:hypothetical protein
MRSRVYSVQTVSVNAAGPHAPAGHIHVAASGMVNSSGWSAPSLDPLIYVTQPADGILDLDFTAEAPPPGTYVTYGFVTVSASVVLRVPDWVRGVRIHASSNTLTATIGSQAGPVSGTSDVPWFVQMA